MGLDTLPDTPLVLVAAVVALAYFVRGVSGFGSGLIAIPLLALSMPLQVAVPIIAVLDNLAAAKHGMQHRAQIVWSDLLPLLPITLLSVVAGLYLLQRIDTEMLQQGMGGFLLLYALYKLSGFLPRRKHSLKFALPFGAAGGMVSALLGTGGPFYVIYLQMRNQTKLAFRATAAMVFLIDGAIRVGGYLLSGLLSSTVLFTVLLVIPVMYLSMRIGSRLHHRLSQQGVERVVSLLIMGSGALLLFR